MKYTKDRIESRASVRVCFFHLKAGGTSNGKESLHRISNCLCCSLKVLYCRQRIPVRRASESIRVSSAKARLYLGNPSREADRAVSVAEIDTYGE